MMLTLCRSRGARTSSDTKQVSPAAGALVCHLVIRDDEMLEHDNGVCSQEPQARSELCDGRQRPGLHVQDSDWRCGSHHFGCCWRLRGRKVSFVSPTGLLSPAPTPQSTGAHVPPPFSPLLQTTGHGGTVSGKTANKKLTITKPLTKTTNCTYRAKKWKDTTQIPSQLSTSFRHQCLLLSAVWDDKASWTQWAILAQFLKLFQFSW